MSGRSGRGNGRYTYRQDSRAKNRRRGRKENLQLKNENEAHRNAAFHEHMSAYIYDMQLFLPILHIFL